MATAPEPSAGRLVRLPFPLQDGEQVLALFRRHWWFLWPKAIILALFAIVPLVIVAWLLDQIGILDNLGVFFWIVVAIWLVYWAARLFMNWYRYHHDIWVVTNQRIVDSFKTHPFSHRLATTDLVNIQDMGVVKSGIIPSILNYGTVVMETAGSDEVTFLIAGVPHPEAVQLLIDRERDRERMRRA